MLLLSLVMLALAPQSLRAQEDDDGFRGSKFSAEAASTFNKRCTACHTYGKGIKVGPDLKGVNQRRKREWLLKFIHESSSVIKSGDPTATALFAEFKGQRMPDWTDLSEKQITDILDYLAVDGPDIRPPDERSAELATPAEIEVGSHLFYGQTGFKYGVKACASCHNVQGLGLRGGTLGPDLTNAYFKYQDRALTSFLRHPCFQWETPVPGTNYLTARESFALKAFLRQVAVYQSTKAATAAAEGSSNR
jgi:mono/diheme cytochrome c family protein